MNKILFCSVFFVILFLAVNADNTLPFQASWFNVANANFVATSINQFGTSIQVPDAAVNQIASFAVTFQLNSPTIVEGIAAVLQYQNQAFTFFFYAYYSGSPLQSQSFNVSSGDFIDINLFWDYNNNWWTAQANHSSSANSSHTELSWNVVSALTLGVATTNLWFTNSSSQSCLSLPSSGMVQFNNVHRRCATVGCFPWSSFQNNACNPGVTISGGGNHIAISWTH